MNDSEFEKRVKLAGRAAAVLYFTLMAVVLYLAFLGVYALTKLVL